MIPDLILLKAMVIALKATLIFQAALVFYFFGKDQKIPYWEIDDCDIYEASCTGRWVHPNIEYANFVWQFTNKGSSFTLNRINGADSCNFITDSVEIQCYNYSGKYEVVEHKRNAMVFKSLETIGYPNNEVILKIEKP